MILRTIILFLYIRKGKAVRQDRHTNPLNPITSRSSNLGCIGKSKPLLASEELILKL
jgi:hypothetical protein